MTRHPALWFILPSRCSRPPRSVVLRRNRPRPCNRASERKPTDIHGIDSSRQTSCTPRAELSGPANTAWHGGGTGGGGGTESRANVFVNDPCLDPAPTAPFPENFFRTVQSETDIAVLNAVENDDDDDDHDRNDHDRNDRDRDSFGRRGDDDEDDRHDRDGDDDGERGVGPADGRGLQRLLRLRRQPSGYERFLVFDRRRPAVDRRRRPAPARALGSAVRHARQRRVLGDPVVAVHHRSKRFYYASLYRNAEGGATSA